MVQNAVAASKHSEIAALLMDMVRNRIQRIYSTLPNGLYRSSDHLETCRELQEYWKCTGLGSETTCFLCLAHPPEFTIGCGHVLCELCTQIFGSEPTQSPSRPVPRWTFEFSDCPLCFQKFEHSTLLSLKPPTAGVRILSIDGGGCRAVIPLQFLKQLSNYAGLECPIQDYFDLAFGTSSGINSWPVGTAA